ncbi:MAG: hypothetical protein ACYDCL_12195 [Myxococcales bacterium]
MKRWMLLLLPAVVCCGRGGPPATADGGESQYLSGFDPPPVQTGYTRYVAPVVTVDPGQSEIFCQYISPAFTSDTDVVNVTGAQSSFGHHVVVYATSFTAPVGTSRLCNNQDMLSVRFLGAIGGEGTGQIGKILPPGVLFRIPAGQALMLNTHFINTSTQPIQGQAVMDLKLATPSPSDQVAGFYTNVTDQFQLSPGNPSPQSTTVSCVVQQDMNFFAFGDHMHYLGFSAQSTLVKADGGTVTLQDDPSWTPEMMFNPNINTWSTPYVQVQAGDTIRTTCSWINDGTEAVTFPTEMCAGFGFFLPGGGPEVDCIDGEWTGGGASADGG